VGFLAGYLLIGRCEYSSPVQAGRLLEGTLGPSSKLWWERVVQANRANPEGLRVYVTPLPFERKGNDHRLAQLLKHFGVDPSSTPNAPPRATVVDIGLPTAAVSYARQG
jgi:hypothetical protein